ncbi:MAG: tetratricopeptide repeat protein [Bacteroidota bacterium]
MNAYTVFIDLSGFTALTETLMLEGNKGAEELSIILNEIFSPLVSLVYARGGFIPYFAGDAFTGIFAEEHISSALEVLDIGMQMKTRFQDRESKFGDFTIGIRFGISYGQVDWGIVGQQKKSYYFRGAPIDSCAECQSIANDLEIVFDETFRQKLITEKVTFHEVKPGFFQLDRLPKIAQPSFHPIPNDPIDRSVALSYLPEAIVDYNQDGEFRPVIATFISFKGVDTHQQLDGFINIILEEIHNFSGYFKEIDFGDKGGVLVALFGAPVSFENNIDRALEFVMALQEALTKLQQDIPLQFRMGVTIGTAYTGFIGGEGRCQYAAVGNRVNLSARLMTYADWGEVLVDSEVQKNFNFRFLHKGDIKYKGIVGNIPTYKLVGRNHDSREGYLSQMVGREQELEQLIDFASPLFDGKNAGIGYVFGEAGIGKSRLAHEFKKIMLNQSFSSWYTCQVDQILRKPFNPFIYFLRDYFDQSPEHSDDLNRKYFEARFQQLLHNLQLVAHKDISERVRELKRTKTILAALIGIDYEDSIWGQLDARGRYQNTIAAITNLFFSESLIQPMVIELEDAHWIDENSTELLHELLRQIKKYPIFLLITSRFLDDGSKPIIIKPGTLEQLVLPSMEIDLNILQPSAVRSFAETALNGSISDDFYEVLLRSTNSNPFYLEQVLEYYAERNLIQKEDGQWTVTDKNLELSNSINAILTARIDRLSNLVRETVKAAAVIGREFELPILSEVMRNQDIFIQHNGNASSLLKEQVRNAERVQIWLAMSELRYIFRHSLLREAVYSMQLRTRLQQIHQSIAEAIEKLYKGKLEERYVDLAFHYEKADIFDKTCEYLRKAADYARSNYQNQQALDYYDRLLQKLNTKDDLVRQLQTHVNRGTVLELIGKWDDCKLEYEQAWKLAKQSRDVLMIGQADNNLGRLLLLQGEYAEANTFLQTALRMFESVDDKLGISRVYGNLGDLNFRQGQYKDAKSYFEKSIEVGYSIDESSVNAQVVSNLGLTYMNQGLYDAGISCQLVQLEVSKRNNDKQGMATLYTNIGIVNLEKGDYDQALQSFEKGLALSEELGNKHLTSIAIGCMGSVYQRKGDYDTAMKHFQRDLELVEEIGDKQGTAIALGLVGELLSFQGDFHKAIEYLQKNLMLSEELGYQKGIAKAVNTLGDIFFYLGQYDRSLHFYDRAIEVTRRISNKLVLGFSLVEKGEVLIALRELEALQLVQSEALEIAKELKNPDLLFQALILKAKVQQLLGDKMAAQATLKEVLHTAETKGQKAEVCFELSELFPEKATYKEDALALYQDLYRETPKFNYKQRIEALLQA